MYSVVILYGLPGPILIIETSLLGTYVPHTFGISKLRVLHIHVLSLRVREVISNLERGFG